MLPRVRGLLLLLQFGVVDAEWGMRKSAATAVGQSSATVRQ
jgi:hypothetical protein